MLEVDSGYSYAQQLYDQMQRDQQDKEWEEETDKVNEVSEEDINEFLELAGIDLDSIEDDETREQIKADIAKILEDGVITEEEAKLIQGYQKALEDGSIDPEGEQAEIDALRKEAKVEGASEGEGEGEGEGQGQGNGDNQKREDDNDQG